MTVTGRIQKAFGFEKREPIEVPMPDGVVLPVIRMERALDA